MPVIYIASYRAVEVVYAFQVNLFGIILVSFFLFHLTAKVGVPLITFQFPSLKKLYHVQ